MKTQLLLHVLWTLARAEIDLKQPLPEQGQSASDAPSGFQYATPTDVIGTLISDAPSETLSFPGVTGSKRDLWRLRKRQDPPADTGTGTGSITAPPSSVSVAPQTTPFTGQVTTQYSSIAGLSTISETTTVIGGNATVLPVWHCDDKATADVCKSCPSATDAPTCTAGFNAIVLLPLLALPGVFMVPPVGLPTLTVGPSGINTYTEPPVETETTTSSTSSSSSEEETSTPPASCDRPTYALRDFARGVEPTSTVGPLPGPTEPATTEEEREDIPIYPIYKPQTTESGNPTKVLTTPIQTAAMGCDGDGAYNGYFNAPFYQFPATFSRKDGLKAIRSFCRDMAEKNKLLGPNGWTVKGGDQTVKAQNFLIGAYHGGLNAWKGEGTGLITVRAIHDVDNKNKESSPGDCSKDGAPVFSFKGNENTCLGLFGQPIDYCYPDDPKSHTDQTAKKGGSFYKQCMFFEVFSSPNDRDFQGSRIGSDGGGFKQNG